MESLTTVVTSFDIIVIYHLCSKIAHSVVSGRICTTDFLIVQARPVAERFRRRLCNQKIAGSNPASGHLATPFRSSKLDSQRLCNQAPTVYCGALKHGAS